jgi:hypothetical protein
MSSIKIIHKYRVKHKLQSKFILCFDSLHNKMQITLEFFFTLSPEVDLIKLWCKFTFAF